MDQPTSSVGESNPHYSNISLLIEVQLHITAYVWEVLQAVQL